MKSLFLNSTQPRWCGKSPQPRPRESVLANALQSAARLEAHYFQLLEATKGKSWDLPNTGRDESLLGTLPETPCVLERYELLWQLQTLEGPATPEG